MEKAWFYERLFSEVVMVMLKDKKKYIKDKISIKISFMHYMKRTRVMLPAVFEEFKVVYIFLLLFSFHYHCQLVNSQLKQKSGRLQPPLPPARPTGLYIIYSHISHISALKIG